MSIVGSGMHKVVHDTSFAELVGKGRYIVVKVFDDQDLQVGQIKLEVAPHAEGENPVSLSVKTTGNITLLNEETKVSAQSLEFESLVWDHD